MDLEYALERLKWFSEWNRTLRFCYEQRILGYNQTLCLLNLAYSSIVVLGFLTSQKDRQLKFSAYPSENSQNLSLFRQLLFLLFKSGDPWKKTKKLPKLEIFAWFQYILLWINSFDELNKILIWDSCHSSNCGSRSGIHLENNTHTISKQNPSRSNLLNLSKICGRKET